MARIQTGIRNTQIKLSRKDSAFVFDAEKGIAFLPSQILLDKMKKMDKGQDVEVTEDETVFLEMIRFLNTCVNELDGEYQEYENNEFKKVLNKT